MPFSGHSTRTPGHRWGKIGCQLGEHIHQALIVVDREDTSQLEAALRREGLDVALVRRNYSPEEARMPRQIKCLLNHSSAWQHIAESRQPCLIVEADFVPCRGLSSFPMPYDPSLEGPLISYLYAGGPVIYHLDEKGGFFGHSATAVAYTLNPEAADRWLELLAEHRRERDFSHYYPWDVVMPMEMRIHKKARLYIAVKDYGEHGGIPNPEHSRNGTRAWHQASSLMAPLAFEPLYAQGSRWRYRFFRSRSRARYIYKFLAGKYFDSWSTFLTLKPGRRQKLLFAIRRTFL